MMNNETNISFTISGRKEFLLKISFRYHIIDKRAFLMEALRLWEFGQKYLTAIIQYRAEE